jgi:hypothetical protein
MLPHSAGKNLNGVIWHKGGNSRIDFSYKLKTCVYIEKCIYLFKIFGVLLCLFIIIYSCQQPQTRVLVGPGWLNELGSCRAWVAQ